MMKILTSILLFFVFLTNGFSQIEASIEFFPVEQLIHPDCKNAEETNKCLSGLILNEVKSAITKMDPTPQSVCDTLKMTIRFNTDLDGKIIDKNLWVSMNDTIVSKKIIDSIKHSMNTFPAFSIKHRKTEKYPSFHKLDYFFTKSISNTYTNIPVPDKKPYEGGEIVMMPMFKEHDYIDSQTDRQNFQASMVAHIQKHFRYPRKAQRDGVEGKVYIKFDIDTNGDITGIKTRAPHELLEQEAIRIITKLDKFKPGSVNGEIKSIPFSIPITFKLR